MKLRTQFIIIMLVFAVILAVIATSAIITNQSVAKVMEMDRRAVDIARGADELGYLSNEYLIYRESRQLTRWQERLASFTEQVSSLKMDKPEQQQLVANIKINQNRLKDVFASVVSAKPGLSRNGNTAIDPAYLHVSWSRMAVQIQGLQSDALHLSRMLRGEADQLRFTRDVLLYVLVGLFGLFLLASYLLTYRRILKSIAALRAGTAVIGSGNLDFAIEEVKDDEIGELYQDFNRMTTDLKAVTASKAELERAQEELRRQREWLSVTLTSIGDAVIATDTAGKITFLNNVAQELTGWHYQEALDKPVSDIFHIINEVTREPGEDIVARVIAAGTIVALANHTALLSRAGREIPIEDSAAPIRNSEGGIIGVVLVFHDVTERRRVQEALLESKEQLAAVFDGVSETLILLDIEGNILAANKIAAQRFNQGKTDLGGKSIYDLLPVRFHKTRKEQISEMIRSKKPVTFQDRLDDSDMEVTFYPVFDAQGNVIQFVSFALDITERKRAEESLAHQAAQLQERSAQLEETNKELESFSYSVSHDLRAPLRAIDGYSRMILKRHGDKLDDDVQAKFNVIRENIQKMGQLIEDLLNLSRISKKAMDEAKFDITDLAKDVWQELQVINPGRVIELTVNNMPEARGDKTLIRQVYLNLLGNAIKFTKHCAAAKIEAGGYPREKEIVYYIKDNGAGFDMEYYNKLFGVFQRLHSDEEYEGTGIGLAIVQRIIHRHGGKVWAEGEMDKGATFYFTLPGEV